MRTAFFFRLFVALSLIDIAGLAQDFHLSQYDANPLYLNPALTGMNLNENWDYRFNANYREQWTKFLGGPTATVAAGFDKPLNAKFSFGQYVLDNRDATGALNTFNFMLSGSYKIIANDPEHHHHLSVGVQMGLLQKNFNPANFVYDSQYAPSSATVFDHSLPSGENFSRESTFNFDANMGIFYRLVDSSKTSSPFAGFSVYHLTQPDESLTGAISKTPMRFNFNAGCYFKLNKEFTLLPQLLYMNQAQANEFNLEVLGFYKLHNSGYEPIIGVAWRNKDAFAIHIGLKQKRTTVRISYDINTSYLQPYSKGRGGLEFSIIYTGKRKSREDSAPSF